VGNTAPREVRLGLVLNGGVSLAIWIGGVTRELDAARRAFDPTTSDDANTAPLYREILAALKSCVVVDVIAGASAGGINGVLLGAAIYNRKALKDLRETWIGLGDFRALLRPAALANPPSLMKGDEVVLPTLRRIIDEFYAGDGAKLTRPLYVYVTATDLFGFRIDYHDTTGRRFQERDHRRVFRFEHDPDSEREPFLADRENVMRDAIWLGDPDAAELLARAARSSSSFPVAFEAHQLRIVDHERGEEVVTPHWLVDGGILDNQPFNPVLNRISVMTADRPVKRVVMYVVPYVTRIGNDPQPDPTAHDTYAAAGKLPRDLPKLQSLDRIAREYEVQKAAEDARRRLRGELTPDILAAAASALFDSYVETRAGEADAVWQLWASDDFRPGDGALAQDPSTDARELAPPPAPRGDVAEANAGETPHPPWLPEQRPWSHGGRWKWGLSPAERIGMWALVFMQDVPQTRVDPEVLEGARQRASHLIATVRRATIALREAFEAAENDAQGHKRDPDSRAREAFERVADRLEAIQSEVERLDDEITRLQETFDHTNEGADDEHRKPLSVQSLLDYEVARNAISIQDDQLSSPFEFVFASAQTSNSLGHEASTPEQKLAGLKLNHFAGFLKESWRANDWLWGRLDGVEHVLRALIDRNEIERLDDTAAAALARTAFPPDATEEEHSILTGVWNKALAATTLPTPVGDDAHAQFLSVLAGDGDAETRARICRRALAARLQLHVLEADLQRVAETAQSDLASGTSRLANGAAWSRDFLDATSLAERVRLFRELKIADETIADETSSRHVFDVGSEAAAVAAGLLAGTRGGLSPAVRGLLATLRGVTLAVSRVIRLVAREPWFGACVFAALVGLLVWAAVSGNTLLGTLLPALVVLVVVSGLALLTIATSVFELSRKQAARWIGFAIFVTIPLAFALLVFATWCLDVGPSWWQWLQHHFGSVAVIGAAALAALAAALALPLGLLGPNGSNRVRRRKALTAYRILVTLGLVALGVGVVVQRWRHGGAGWVGVANEHRGIIVVLLLLAVLVGAAAIETWIAWIRRPPPPAGD
jgi:predicted acylesterase/phospholipase RssA